MEMLKQRIISDLASLLELGISLQLRIILDETGIHTTISLLGFPSDTVELITC